MLVGWLDAAHIRPHMPSGVRSSKEHVAHGGENHTHHGVYDTTGCELAKTSVSKEAYLCCVASK